MFIIGVLAMFIPFVYVFIPAYQSQLCMCNFFELDRHAFSLDNANVFKTLQVMNLILSFVNNYGFVLMLVWMGLKIRHIKDNLSLVFEN
jgi:hypothetical protein